MPQVINTNIQSLTAQRNLNLSQSALQTSIQRLSSGLRVNSAKDDAAGLAISERFTTQIRGLDQAVRNANDGISLTQVGEGALAEITSNLQRIRELAVQSANATNSDSDRQALDLEVQERLAEIDRIAAQTNFNGRKILDGSFGNAAFQVGANVGETINVGLSTSVRANQIGATATSTSLDLTSLVGNESGAAGAFTSAVTRAATEAGDGEAVSLSVGGVTLISEQQTNLTAAVTYTTPATTDTGDAGNTVTVSVTLSDASGTDFNTVGFSATATGDGATLAATALESALAQAVTDGDLDGFTFTGDLSDGDLQFIRADGQQFNVAMTTTRTSVTTTVAGADAAGSAAGVGGLDSATGTQITVDDAAVDSAISSSLSALTDAGITVSGTAAAGTLVFSRSDGAAFDIALSNNINDAGSGTTGGFDLGGTDAFGSGAALANGTISIDNSTDLTLATGDLTIQIGDANAVNVTGTFTGVQELLDGVKEAIGNNASAVLNSDGTSFDIVAGFNLRLAGTQVSTIFNTANQSVDATGDISTGNVLTVDASNDIINRVDSALTSVSSLRSTFGAIQNRFESTIVNLSTAVENLSASRSRIRDADFAAETAALTQAQILQQAGIAALAQANAQPQNVLALLQ